MGEGDRSTGQPNGEAPPATGATDGAGRGGWARHVNWWLLLIAPLAAVVAVIVGVAMRKAIGDDAAFRRQCGRMADALEYIGPSLLAAATAIYAARYAVGRRALDLILTVFAAVLLCREIHFVGTGPGVYVGAGLVATWAALWHKRIAKSLRDWRHTSWLVAAAGAYLLAVLVDRRVFSPKHLGLIPHEELMHTFIEEAAETVAHVLLVITAVAGSWKRPSQAGPSVRRDQRLREDPTT